MGTSALHTANGPRFVKARLLSTPWIRWVLTSKKPPLLWYFSAPLCVLIFLSMITLTRLTFSVHNNNNNEMDKAAISLEQSKAVRDMLSHILSTCGMEIKSTTNATINSNSAEEEQLLTVVDPRHDTTRMDQEEKVDTFTLVVVRCKANITWLAQVPTDWRIVVYDKCKRNTVAELPDIAITRHTPSNQKLAEECNGYFDYMHDYYHNLTDVTVFMHDDGLIPYDTKHKPEHYHTPFYTFDPIVQVTRQFITRDNPFLHLGVQEMGESWATNSYHGDAMYRLWPCFATPQYNNNNKHNNNNLNSPREISKLILPKKPMEVSFKPAAHFAVHKDQIQKRPQSTYWAILQQLRMAWQVQPGVYPDARMFCCAMERMWHVFFGLPAILPQRAMASDLLNLTTCEMCHRNATYHNDTMVGSPAHVVVHYQINQPSRSSR